jgi:hypothetical protein
MKLDLTFFSVVFSRGHDSRMGLGDYCEDHAHLRPGMRARSQLKSVFQLQLCRVVSGR